MHRASVAQNECGWKQGEGWQQKRRFAADSAATATLTKTAFSWKLRSAVEGWRLRRKTTGGAVHTFSWKSVCASTS